MKHLLILSLCITVSQLVSGQNTSLNNYVLDSVLIEKVSSKAVYKSYAITPLPTSPAKTSSLTELLNRNTSIFIREYGKGMLAGISLRGTGATHSQIVWNSIPINSILNGQTDLNTCSPGSFDEIFIKKGGSSVTFGSGAIGGAIFLNDKITFSNKFSLSNHTKIGSFNTGLNRFKIVNSNNKSYKKLGFQIQKSTNDYPYPGYDIKNENGSYQGWDFSLINGVKFQRHQLYIKSKFSKLDRETSRTLYMSQNAELFTANTNILSGWLWQTKHFTSHSVVAYLHEDYKYFFNKHLPGNSHSAAQTYLAKNFLNFGLQKPYNVLIGNEISRQYGTGDNIGKHIRTNFATFLIWSHHLNNFYYKLKIRHDFNNTMTIPLTGAIEMDYSFHNYHQLRFNVSKNFRLPTFNDLYWTPGGNPHLHPETSYSTDAGYDFNNGKIEAHLSFFYIDSKNLIKWILGQNQYWHPENFESVRYSGIELSARKTLKINDKLHFSNQTNINYNRAVNRANQKFLPYTPQLTGLNIFNITYKTYALSYLYRYQGKIYTTTTNTKYLPAYQIHSLSLSHNYNQHINFQFNINNLLNTYYENIPSRPQPGRYYELILNFKI